MTNVAQKELDKFNAMGAHWWDPEGPLKTLHQVQPVRMRFIREATDLYKKRILDVGCGGGLLTEALSGFSPDVTGIDMAEEVLDMARTHAKSLPEPPKYLALSAETLLETSPPLFDIITCLELIEHVPSPETLVETLSKLLKPGGDLFISTLNRTLKSYLMAIVGAEYLMKLIPKGTHSYDAFIKPSELSNLARKHGLRCLSLHGITYRLLTKDFVLSQDCSVNYIAHFRKE